MNRFLTIFSALFSLFISCKSEPNNDITTTVFRVKNGYGYEISIRGKVLIKQNTIPALIGETAFCDSTDAAKVGELVIEKIKSKKSPSVSAADLKSLNIRTKC